MSDRERLSPESNPASPRVVVIEDRSGTREALVAGLQAHGLDVVGVYASGEAALAGGSTLRAAHVALVDLGLPGLSGIETIARLRLIVPDLSILVLSVFEDGTSVLKAIEAGAAGYLLKGGSVADVCAAVKMARAGLTPISPAVAHHLLRVVRQRSQAAEPHRFDLTPREQEVLALLVRGHTYASVGLALGIALSTVQGHVKNLYRKLEVASKAEAAHCAVVHRLVAGDP